MSLTAILATSPDLISHGMTSLTNSVTVLAETIDIPTQTPPEAEKWLRIPGLIRYAVIIVGVTAMIASAGVMAVEKFTDHGFGNKGMKIAGYAMLGGLVATTASALYGFVSG